MPDGISPMPRKFHTDEYGRIMEAVILEQEKGMMGELSESVCSKFAIPKILEAWIA